MRLALGSAAWSQPYAHRLPPSAREVDALLDAALADGCRWIDTAPGYGSQPLIGDFLRRHAVPFSLRVATKVPAGGTAEEIDRLIDQSRRELRMSQLDIVQLHNATADSFTSPAWDALCCAKNDDRVRMLGATVYDLDAAHAARLEGVPYIQVPYNLRDQRFAAFLRYRPILRSVWLRGRLASPAWRRQFALRFAVDSCCTVLVGVRSVAEWREAIQTLRRGPLPAWQTWLATHCATTHPRAIDPRLWEAA